MHQLSSLSPALQFQIRLQSSVIDIAQLPRFSSSTATARGMMVALPTEETQGGFIIITDRPHGVSSRC